MNEAALMTEAIRLSLEKMREGCGGPFGAIVVQNETVIGRGWNQVTSANDPTAHAEISAIREACRFTQNFHLPGAVLYASCEPCPMCLAAAYWARLDRIYYAATRSDAAAVGFDDAFLYEELNRPNEERTLPMMQLLRSEALVVLDEWQRKPDKILY